MGKKILVATITIALALSADAGTDENTQVRRCQQLKQAIERYTDLRRAGGSTAQMERWKKTLRAKKDAWNQLSCRDIKHRLK